VWEAVVDADRSQFERFAMAGLSFPHDHLERRFALQGAKVRIGRRRGDTDEPIPEIDLSGPSEDPGVSHLHAVLVRQEDGTYALRDLGSTNGTTVNDSSDPVGPDLAVRLTDGDRIRVGAWTTITLRQR
jgi:pSer/pThr/pTyr-binding forkhead associated (FHA) protein